MMKNIYNWLFGSFFRTLGRVLVYIIFGIVLSYLLKDLNLIPKDLEFLGISNVYAESVATQTGVFSIEIGGETWTGDNYFTVGANSERELRLKMWNWEGVTRPYTYLMTSGCVTYGYVGRSYVTNASHTVNWFDESQFVPYDTYPQVTCTTPNGQSGWVFHMQFRVGQYQDYDGTGEELYVTSILHLKNVVNYSVQYHFYSWYLSSDDLLSRMKQDSALMTAYNSAITDMSSSLHTDSQNTQNAINSAKDQAHTDSQNTQNAINDQTATIKDDNVSESENKAVSFFNDFTTDNHGLTGIITAPLNAIQSLTSSTCTPLELPLPFVNQNLTLPCMRSIYEQYFGDFINIYDIVTLGIISYWVMVRIFGLVKDFKNPDHDEIEVLAL